jgi:hypothetical protein
MMAPSETLCHFLFCLRPVFSLGGLVAPFLILVAACSESMESRRAELARLRTVDRLVGFGLSGGILSFSAICITYDRFLSGKFLVVDFFEWLW